MNARPQCLCVRFVYEVNPGQGQRCSPAFRTMAKFDETYSAERLDVGFVNEVSIPKYKGRVCNMANNSHNLFDEPRIKLGVGDVVQLF